MSAAAQPSLADRLAHVRVDTRDDLEVTRHVFRGRVSYVVTDPVNFRSHSLGVGDYQLFAAIRRDEPLGSTLDWLTASGVISPDGAEDFYAFVLELHSAGFLSLPVSNADVLYERHLRKRALARRRVLSAPLFFRIPVWNPDRFLESTVGLVRPLFSRAFMLAWAVLGLLALVVVAARWREVVEAAAGLLRLESLAVTWVVLVLLKLFHELGHGYACRLRGGAVPEMGVFMILLTPCAYVDASAAWGFSRLRDRQLVNLGGMYFESLVAIPAVLVWAAVDPGPLRDVLFLIAMTASVTTIGFNLNPLMKFDGYHVLADASGMPNLQSRSFEAVGTVARRRLLGLEVPPVPRPDRAILLAYGVAAIAYRVVLILAIATLLAVRFGTVGLLAASVYVAANVLGRLRRLVRYLVADEETRPVRGRAVAAAALAVLGIPAAMLAIPVPSVVRADGVVQPERREVVHAPVSGTLDGVLVRPGDAVEPETPVVRLADPSLDAVIAAAEARLEAARIRRRLAEAEPERPAAIEQARRMVVHAARVREERRDDRERLAVTVPSAGRLLSGPEPRERGRWVEAGEPIAVVGGGPAVVRMLLTEADLVDASPAPGQPVEIRLPGETGPPRLGRIRSVAPAGSRDVDLAALTAVGGGGIATDAEGTAFDQPFFTVTIALDEPPPAGRDGSRAAVRMPGEPATVARQLYRRFRAFVDRLAAG